MMTTGSTSRPTVFRCRRCGRCCSRPGNIYQLASPEEWQLIIDYLQETGQGRWTLKCRCSRDCNHEWEGEVRGLEDLPRFFLEDIHPCPFLRKEQDARGRLTGRTQCAIYQVRPAVCQLYPFDRENARVYDCPGYDPEGGGDEGHRTTKVQR